MERPAMKSQMAGGTDRIFSYALFCLQFRGSESLNQRVAL